MIMALFFAYGAAMSNTRPRTQSQDRGGVSFQDGNTGTGLARQPLPG
jgi:hypothetical protein